MLKCLSASSLSAICFDSFKCKVFYNNSNKIALLSLRPPFSVPQFLLRSNGIYLTFAYMQPVSSKLGVWLKWFKNIKFDLQSFLKFYEVWEIQKHEMNWWQMISSMPDLHYHFITIINNSLHIEKFDLQSCLKFFEIWDIQKHKRNWWQIISSMPNFYYHFIQK